MGAYYEKVKKMTNEPGVLLLAQVADDQEQRLAELKAQLDDCCPPHAPLVPPAASETSHAAAREEKEG